MNLYFMFQLSKGESHALVCCDVLETKRTRWRRNTNEKIAKFPLDPSKLCTGGRKVCALFCPLAPHIPTYFMGNLERASKIIKTAVRS